MLGMDETALSKIVNGFREPSGELREKIAKLLETDPAWLFERTNSTQEPTRRPRAANAATEP
jgi:transcriptional regulator with XRE-family HTH domain